MKLRVNLREVRRNMMRWWHSAFSPNQRHFLLGIAVIWLLFGITAYGIAAHRMIEVTMSQNAARAPLLSADINRLPKFTDVTIGETSGLLPNVQSTRQSMADQIENGIYTPSVPPLWTLAYPTYWTSFAIRTAHTERIAPIREQLVRSVDDIDKFGKFVAYSPTIDLGTTLAMPDASERLERTEQGLRDTRSALLGSGLAQSNESLAIFDAITTQTTALTPETLGAWAEQVATAQRLILEDMHSRDILTSDYKDVLADIYKSYQ